MYQGKLLFIVALSQLS